MNIKKFSNNLKKIFCFNFINIISLISFLVPSIVVSQISELDNNNFTYSFFAETGETESDFTIAGRNFPVRVGSVGLKAMFNPNKNR